MAFIEKKQAGEVAQEIEPWRRTLLDASDRIERVGLWKAAMVGCKQRRECVFLAISGCASDPRESTERLYRYLGLRGEDVLGAIYAWNDAPERTEAEVISTMRAAARS